MPGARQAQAPEAACPRSALDRSPAAARCCLADRGNGDVRRRAAGLPAEAPYPVEVEAGKTCFWCGCGRSAKQPFCDGTHKGSGFIPLKHTAEKDGRLWLCGCKQTARWPLCDGRHKAL